MVILSAAICTKSGKSLLSRQFHEMSRVRIEGLLSAFPKLIDTGKQHTYIETESVRYVYQPMEKLFLLLITNKSSNIVEDLDTLRLLSQIVKDKCKSYEEKDILEDAFELMFAFDEVISLGYRENLSLEQVKTILEMDSHEENLQKLIYQTKVEDAIQQAKSKAKEIAQKKKLNPRHQYPGGISSQDTMFGDHISTSFREDIKFNRDDKIGKMRSYETKYEEKKQQEKKPQPKRMIFTSKKKKSDLIKELVDSGEVKDLKEEEEEEKETIEESNILKQSTELSSEPIHIKIEENIDAEVNREGGIQRVDLTGTMFLTVLDKKQSNIKLILNEDRDTSSYLAQCHPKIDKQAFSKSDTIVLKDKSKSFPTGNPLKVLTWRLQKKEESILPIQVTCWPSETSGGMSISMEYELLKEDFDLEDIQITVPLPSNDPVKVEDIEQGTYKQEKNKLTWILERVNNSNSTGSIEFDVKGGDENSFFPIHVNFVSRQILSGLSVKDVQLVHDEEQSCKYSTETILTSRVTIV